MRNDSTVTHITTQSSQLTLGFTLGAVHFMGLKECITACTLHYNIEQNSFIALQVLRVLPVHLFPTHPPSVTTELFAISIVLSLYS